MLTVGPTHMLWRGLTKTKYDGVCAQNDGAPSAGEAEEVANTAKHHEHADGNVDNAAVIDQKMEPEIRPSFDLQDV